MTAAGPAAEPAAEPTIDSILEKGAGITGRIARVLAAKRGLDAASRSRVAFLLFKTYVCQAQAEGVLPARLRVVRDDGNGPADRAVAVWDPGSGIGWTLVAEGAPPPEADPFGTAVPDGDATRALSEVRAIPSPGA